MILTCPACQTQYIVPEGSLGRKPRTVKCAACGYSWRQNPIDVTEIDLTPPPAPVESTRYDDEPTVSAADMAHNLRWQQALQADIAAIAHPPVSVWVFLRRTVLWLLGFALATWIALIYLRDDLARVWPPSNLFFETIGYPEAAAGTGLKFSPDAKVVMLPDAVPPRLHVTGSFTNMTDHAVALPILQARLFDAKGIWLKDWAIPLQTMNYIGGLKSLGFDYTLPQVPMEAHSLTFRFVDA